MDAACLWLKFVCCMDEDFMTVVVYKYSNAGVLSQTQCKIAVTELIKAGTLLYYNCQAAYDNTADSLYILCTKELFI